MSAREGTLYRGTLCVYYESLVPTHQGERRRLGEAVIFEPTSSTQLCVAVEKKMLALAALLAPVPIGWISISQARYGATLNDMRLATYQGANGSPAWNLRADYSLRCYDREWVAMAAYASVWIVLFVFGLLALVCRQLHKFHHRARVSTATGGHATVTKPISLSFLVDDYRTGYWWWEVSGSGVESE